MKALSGINSHQQVNQFINDRAGRCPFVLRQLIALESAFAPYVISTHAWKPATAARYCTVLSQHHCVYSGVSTHYRGVNPAALYLPSAAARKWANTPAKYIASCR